jgi:plastocyanin
MFRPTIALIWAVAALALIAAGCGGSSGDSSAGAPGGATQPVHGAPGTLTAPAPATKPATASAKAIDVSVKDNVFDPVEIHAKVGQQITWNQDGQIAHTVTATDGAKFDSGALNPGKSFSYTPKKAGTIQYLCSFHQGMTGTIVVE